MRLKNQNICLAADYLRLSREDGDKAESDSIRNQRELITDFVKQHPDIKLVDEYVDEGISGTSLQHREQFQRMMEDCRAGKIDLIITKSVSRFARNIVDCIAKQRELANMTPQVGVFFETEHIYSLDGTSEMMMAVLAAAAQEESHTKSEIMNISIEQRFSRGIFLTPELLGYDKDEDGNLVINETEADTVKLCYYLFLGGFPTSEIAELLTQLERRTKAGNTKWTSSSVVSVLKNERHCGDVLSRKTYTPNYLDHKAKKNEHNRNQYRQLDHHEAIVSHEVFNATQKMLAAYKYRKKGAAFPTLQVVDAGVLKGYVPVNRAWTGFTSEEYDKASMSAYDGVKEIDVDTIEQSGVESHFDLSGYEIVRSQFFSTRYNPALTISDGRIAFNTACLRKFNDVEYVELLLNTVEKCIAIRPCYEDNPNAIRWGTLKDGKWVVLPKSCKGLSEPLYNMMKWIDEYKYRFRGQYHANGEEQILIFDLEEPEIIKTERIDESATDEQVQDEENTSNKKAKVIKTVLYMENWCRSFGDCTDAVVLQRVKYGGNWDVLRPAKTVDGMQIITAEVIRDLLNEAENLINRMKDVG